jgi:hypothetical protein
LQGRNKGESKNQNPRSKKGAPRNGRPFFSDSAHKQLFLNAFNGMMQGEPAFPSWFLDFGS